MKLFGIFIAGVAGGVLGGMGMGGGTLLIPALTALFGIEQQFSQTINLVAFIPMAVVALVLHVKNGLIETKGMPLLAVFALIFSVGASILEKFIGASFQKKAFGIFLIVLALFQVHELQKAGNKTDNGSFDKNRQTSKNQKSSQKT